EIVCHKSAKIAALVQSLEGRELDARYLGYFECFNRQLFFEAHEVLEDLWLLRRGEKQDLFYKGLIQLAGAFVHVQKKRVQPAAALFKLARRNLMGYSPNHEWLNVMGVLELIDHWLERLKKPGEQLLSPQIGRAHV